MKKYFKYYAICWAIALVVFNVITFVITGATCGLSVLTPSFWVGYASITIAFIGNFVCSILFFKEKNRDKVFLNYSVIRLSYGALIASFIVGAIAMIVPAIPYWVGIIINVLILAFYAIAITKGSAAADIVQSRGQHVKQKTVFIKMLTADADSLVKRTKSDETKALAKKVYEAVRYSDPMSSPQLNDIETQIKNEFAAFSDAIKNDDIVLATMSSEELINLVNDRNNKCKVLK